MGVAEQEEDVERLQKRMVDELVQLGAIRDVRVEEAFQTVRRHLFVPDAPLEEVYRDRAIVTHRDVDGVPISSSSQPQLMARMLEQLGVTPGSRVLEIGAGTGYNAALLGRLVGAQGSVLTVDIDSGIAALAERHLADAGASNVSVQTGNGWQTAAAAPFDRIEITVGVWDLTPVWPAQLAPDGVLVAPLWLRAGLQASIAFRKTASGLTSVSTEPCGFMRMRGPGAGPPTYAQVGEWTVSLDEPNPEAIGLLTSLLRTEPRTDPAPRLHPGWFTPIALREPEAVHLFSQHPTGPVTAAGILSHSPPGLAIIDTNPGTEPANHTISSFGSPVVLDRLLHLIGHTPPIDIADLNVTAHTTGEPAEAPDAVATIVRPNFTFTIRQTAR